MRPTASTTRHDRHPPDMWLLVCVFTLATLGVVMVYSASQYEGLRQFSNTGYLAQKQIIWFFVSLVGFAVASLVDWRWVKRSPYVAGGAALVLLALVHVFSERTLGATSRFRIGPMSVQPSEFAKLLLLLFWAAVLSKRKNWDDVLKSGKDVLPLVLLTACLGLIVKEPDVGGASIMAFMIVALWYLKGLPMMGLGALAGSGAMALVAMIVARPYRLSRIEAFLDPWSAPLDKGYNAIQSMLAFASGGITGVGLGNSRQKFDYLPEQHADFIYSVVGEEFGLLGAMAIAFLFAVILWRGMAIARKQEDEFHQLLASGIVCLLVGQGLINMLVAVSALPATGLTLPFVSYGGSSLLVSAIMAGILVNLSSCKMVQAPVVESMPEPIRRKPVPVKDKPSRQVALAPRFGATVERPAPKAKGREVSRGAAIGTGGRGNGWASLPRY